MDLDDIKAKSLSVQPLGVVPYALSVFASATLLFLVQPIVAKEMLPWFGGASAVWTACMVFFQTVLLFGYAYAHWSTRSLSRSVRKWTHVSLLSLSSIALWLPGGMHSDPAPVNHPALAALAFLAGRIGLPYFALSSTSPLLQAWYSEGEPKRIPYRLFALSNLGSLIALLAYPFVIEPALDTQVQLELWRATFVLFAALCSGVAIYSLNLNSSPKQVRPISSTGSFSQISVWTLLAACTSALLLAVTNDLCQEIAPIPLLWIAPLAIYLVTFILCFDHQGFFRPGVYCVLVPAALAGLVWIHSNPDSGIWLAVSLSLAGLFVACMFCHSQLAELKPETSRLTSFYMSISMGGALGALFVGLLAPALFPDFFELQVAVAACLVLSLYFLFGYRSKLFLGIAGVTALLLLRAFGALGDSGTVTFRGRNFYGALSIREQVIPPLGTVRTMVHGGTVHGGQALANTLEAVPRYYYGRDSGVGLVLQRPAGPQRVGVVGLGVGTLAAYGRHGDFYRFYEINPLVWQLALSHFTFLRDSGAAVKVVLGDARLSLESEPDQNFDTLILDAFSGDSIPIHLLTREAFQCYFRHLKSDGVIAVHISNRYLDLRPVVSRNAAASGRLALQVVSPPEPAQAILAAEWILITNRGSFQNELQGRGTLLVPGNAHPWTDQYSNILSVLK